MKKITVLLMFMIVSELAYANDIDKLKTKEDVQRFYTAKLDSTREAIPVFDGESDTLKYGKGKFFKVDLDNNGLTDLVVNGRFLFVVLDKGGGKYEFHSIAKGVMHYEKSILLDIFQVNKNTLVSVRLDGYNANYVRTSETDTLIFKFGGFMEYNNTPTQLKIEQISFAFSGGFTDDLIFKLTINSSRAAVLNVPGSNGAANPSKKQGIFKWTVDNTSFNQLVGTLNYLKFSTLKPNYCVGWTCDRTSILELTYDNGKKKKITDYGAVGTFGLATLYAQLFELREKQEWENLTTRCIR